MKLCDRCKAKGLKEITFVVNGSFPLDNLDLCSKCFDDFKQFIKQFIKNYKEYKDESESTK